MQKELKLNRYKVITMSNQIVWDLSDFDMGGITIVELEEETTQPGVSEPKRAKPKCDCGSWAVGVQDYMTGHNDDCPVNENKTPIM